MNTNALLSRQNRGFTLIELMTVILIAALLLAVAVPSFDTLIKRNNVDALQSRLSSALATARTEAASRNKTITICASNNGLACTGADHWNLGWIVFEDGSVIGTVDAGETVIEVYQSTSSTYRVAMPETHVSFNTQGFLAHPSSTTPQFVVCGPDNDARYARGLAVNKSGLIMKSKSGSDGQHVISSTTLTCS